MAGVSSKHTPPPPHKRGGRRRSLQTEISPNAQKKKGGSDQRKTVKGGEE